MMMEKGGDVVGYQRHCDGSEYDDAGKRGPVLGTWGIPVFQVIHQNQMGAGAHFWNQITMCCPLSLFQEGQERCKTGIVDDYFDWIKMIIGTFFLVPGWGCWGEKTKTPSRGETSRPHFYKVGNAIITKVSCHYHHWDFHLSQAIKELRTCWTEAIVPQLEVSFFCLDEFFSPDLGISS